MSASSGDDAEALVARCARARTAPDAFRALAERARAAPDPREAWPAVAALLALDGSRVARDAAALAAETLARLPAEDALAAVDALGPRLAPPAREVAALVVEAHAGSLDPDHALRRLRRLLVDGNDAVRRRARDALGAVALHHPTTAARELAALAEGRPREREAAAGALWGLASRDVPAALDVARRFVDAGDAVGTRLALAQLGFAWRYRPFAAEERAAMLRALAEWARAPTGPGKRAVGEALAPLDAFHAAPDVLVELAAFRRELGLPAPGPAPRPRAPCSGCGAPLDYGAYFCHACGDEKPHNPLRRLRGLPVARGPGWPKPA